MVLPNVANKYMMTKTRPFIFSGRISCSFAKRGVAADATSLIRWCYTLYVTLRQSASLCYTCLACFEHVSVSSPFKARCALNAPAPLARRLLPPRIPNPVGLLPHQYDGSGGSRNATLCNVHVFKICTHFALFCVFLYSLIIQIYLLALSFCHTQETFWMTKVSCSDIKYKDHSVLINFKMKSFHLPHESRDDELLISGNG